MSAGHDIDHDEIDERTYLKVQNDAKFQAILARGFAVNYDYDVPYLGGYSVDGGTVYIDCDVPLTVYHRRVAIVLRPNGLVRGICTHEHWEKTAMIVYGWPYEKSHTLANRAEEDCVKQLDFSMELYNRIWDPITRLAEQKLRRKDVKLPPDLDRTPYSGTRLAA